jgi:hypothetical protein
MAELPGAAVWAAANIVSFVFRVSLADTAAAAPPEASQPQLATLDHDTGMPAAAEGAATWAYTAPADKTGTGALAPQLQGSPALIDADAAVMDLDGAATAYHASGSYSGSGSGGWDSAAAVDSFAAAAVPGEPFAGAACRGACQVLLWCAECADHAVLASNCI